MEDYGGQRTDIGKLGAGIYFASSAGASVRYSTPGQVRGSRFMLICDVALGNVKVRFLFVDSLKFGFRFHFHAKIVFKGKGISNKNLDCQVNKGILEYSLCNLSVFC